MKLKRTILLIIVAGGLLVVGYIQQSEENQYQVNIFSLQTGEEVSDGLLFAPTTLNNDYNGECRWQEQNTTPKACRLVITGENIGINLDPTLAYGKRIFSGTITKDEAGGVIQRWSRDGIHSIATFKLYYKP